MLNFTHNSRTKSSNPYQLQFQDEYQPITITNAGSGKPLPLPQPKKTKKNLIKAHSNNKKKSIQRTQKSRNLKNNIVQNKQWNSQTVVQKVGLFDKRLKKDELAAAQRQIRAQSRRKQNPRYKQFTDKNEKVLTKQQEIHRKKIQIVAEEQQKQIKKLKQLIDKQRREKQRNDMQYQEKKRRIEAQRKQLIQIQKQIQRQGPKATKQIKQKIRSIDSGMLSQDKIRLKQRLDQQNPSKQFRQRNYQNYNQLTQSQSIANQKNRIRQQQLQYLVDQRQKNHKQYQKNTLGYTPTLIPLLSRASYKIISTHVSSLVELLIDDILQEQVYLLQAIELQAKAQSFRDKQKQIIKDYAIRLQNFIEEHEQIEDKLGKYNQMKFEQIYKPQRKVQQLQRGFKYYTPQIYTKLQSKLGSDDVEQIGHRIDRFKRYVSSFDEYKPANIDMFRQVTEEVINQAIQKLAKELDNGAGQFVNIVFRSQFD